MFPISRQHGNSGLGMGYEHFAKDFLQVCEEHTRDGRAQGFAFVFYNIEDDSIRAALKQEGGFRTLNEASGKDMTIFYLRDDFANELAAAFNRRFRSALQIQDQIQPPCIVFFRVDGEEISDISLHMIDGRTDQPHLIVEYLRQLVSKTIADWSRQGDISALNPIPILGFVASMGRLFKGI